MTNKRSYQRHLPHEIPDGYPIFLNWNLKGAMPQEIIEKLLQERDRLQKQAARTGESAAARKLREDKLIFAMADRFLDHANDGPLHLKDPTAAKIVEDSILFGDGDRYHLYAWCVMANHVHVLLTPIWDLKELTQGIKGYTAYEINRLQKARGASSGRTSPTIIGCGMRRNYYGSSNTLKTTRYLPIFASVQRIGRGRRHDSARSGRQASRMPVGQAFQPDIRYLGKIRQAGKPDLRRNKG